MTVARTMLTALAAAALTIGGVAVVTPPASAAPAAVAATCTAQQRADLKSTINGLRDQIKAVHLTPQQREDRRTARKAAIAALRAQARPNAADPAAIAAAKADLKAAKVNLRAATDPSVRQALRQQVTALRATLEGLRGTRLTDAQRADLHAKILALRAADRQDNEARHSTIAGLRGQLTAARTELRACRV